MPLFLHPVPSPPLQPFHLPDMTLQISDFSLSLEEEEEKAVPFAEVLHLSTAKQYFDVGVGSQSPWSQLFRFNSRGRLDFISFWETSPLFSFFFFLFEAGNDFTPELLAF